MQLNHATSCELQKILFSICTSVSLYVSFHLKVHNQSLPNKYSNALVDTYCLDNIFQFFVHTLQYVQADSKQIVEKSCRAKSEIKEQEKRMLPSGRQQAPKFRFFSKRLSSGEDASCSFMHEECQTFEFRHLQPLLS